MGLYDIEEFEEIDDFFNSDYVPDEDNIYLGNAEKAIELISKILSRSHKSDKEKNTIKTIDYILDVELLGCLRKIQLHDEAKLQIKLAQLSDKLLEEKKYQALKNKSVVGIGGKFSAGKSKFINSLLSTEELLPEDQNPTTSIATYIVHGAEEKIIAYTTDNNAVELDVKAMQALTHKFYEHHGMGFSSFINSLVIMEPDMPFEKLIFLDTPGYSKPDDYGTSKTKKNISDANKAYEQLKNVDYLIWLVDIENGELSETDISFIKKLNIEIPILVVANKCDKKVDDEVKKIVKHIENTVKQVGVPCFAVTAYSSWLGEEWNNQNYIASYLEMAQENQKSRDDILEQIYVIEERVGNEIAYNIENKVKERNELNNVIFRSDNIMEIKTIVDIYGETMESIRDMKICESMYMKNKRKLNSSLNRHFKGKTS